MQNNLCSLIRVLYCCFIHEYLFSPIHFMSWEIIVYIDLKTDNLKNFNRCKNLLFHSILKTIILWLFIYLNMIINWCVILIINYFFKSKTIFIFSNSYIHLKTKRYLPINQTKCWNWTQYENRPSKISGPGDETNHYKNNFIWVFWIIKALEFRKLNVYFSFGVYMSTVTVQHE